MYAYSKLWACWLNYVLRVHEHALLVVACYTMVACGICGNPRGQHGLIHFVGVWRCSDCVDWEIDHAVLIGRKRERGKERQRERDKERRRHRR
jgi:hypothetical protein